MLLEKILSPNWTWTQGLSVFEKMVIFGKFGKNLEYLEKLWKQFENFKKIGNLGGIWNILGKDLEISKNLEI